MFTSRSATAARGFGQVKGVPNGLVVDDDVERGLCGKIPLWLFGFL